MTATPKWSLRLCLLLVPVFLPVLLSVASAAQLEIIDKPIIWTEYKEKLIRDYAQTHYALDRITIVPQAVVVHWTASSTFESAYYTFYHEARSDGTLNVSSHFIVDRDGQVYRLTPENALNRHVIGYNWCSIGIENVGGTNGLEDLTPAQMEANDGLIRYLQDKYPTIHYVFGHYQQDQARASGLYIENVPGYYYIKIDPGKTFMAALHDRLKDTGLIFYEE